MLFFCITSLSFIYLISRGFCDELKGLVCKFKLGRDKVVVHFLFWIVSNGFFKFIESRAEIVNEFYLIIKIDLD